MRRAHGTAHGGRAVGGKKPHRTTKTPSEHPTRRSWGMWGAREWAKRRGTCRAEACAVCATALRQAHSAQLMGMRAGAGAEHAAKLSASGCKRKKGTRGADTVPKTAASPPSQREPQDGDWDKQAHEVFAGCARPWWVCGAAKTGCMGARRCAEGGGAGRIPQNGRERRQRGVRRRQGGPSPEVQMIGLL